MNKLRFAIVGLAILVAAASSVRAQSQYIGYVYPAGGQQGTTFPIRLGGQGLIHASDLVVSGEGVSVRLVDYYRVMSNQEFSVAQPATERVAEEGGDAGRRDGRQDGLVRVSRAIGPAACQPRSVLSLPDCGTANALTPSSASNARRSWRNPKTQDRAKRAKSEPPKSAKEVAKQKLIERIQRRFAEDERNPAVRSQTELVFAEVTVAPDAKPGRREIRVITKRGVSNPLPFYVGQVPEVARKPMKTCQLPVLGKEYLAQRKRPPEEEEMRITVPCTMNGQIAPGEVNRYRFQAEQGAAPGHLRQGSGPGALRRRRRSRLVPGRAEAPRRQRQGVGVQRRFPFQPRPVDLFRGPRGRRVCADHQRGAVSRPRELRVSHYHR